MTYKEKLINSIEADFVFSKNPINRFKINNSNIIKNDLNKNEQINQLKKQIVNHIENQNYSVYLGKQSKEWFSNFVKLVINNITINSFKVLGKKEAEYLQAL